MEILELKEFLDVKFEMNDRILNEKFTNVELQLKTIVDQTTKTNGRVSKLENKMEESEKFNELHVLLCPVKKELDEYKKKIESDLILFGLFAKYPKISTIVLVVLTLFVLEGGIEKIIKLIGFTWGQGS